MEKLMILDGNSIVNRAFYGIRLLTNSEGLYTNAVYGFLNILFKYLDEEKPDYLCVAFDLPAPTFRHQQYEQYKAHRKGMPDELAVQIPVLKEVLSAMNIAMFSLEGFEADDIIGTASAHCEKSDKECVVLTGDRDGLQLATDKTRIKLVTTRLGSSETTDYTAKTVFEKYGVTPSEYIEVKGLMGDSSDNIPGVAGIGEKTAFELIKAFHSIENIYENLSSPEIKDGVRKKLQEGRDSAFMSRSLAMINKNVPIDIDFKQCTLKDYDNDRLIPLFKRLNFNSFITRLKLEEAPVAKQEAIVTSDIAGVKSRLKSAGMMFYRIYDGKIAVSTGKDDIVTVPCVPEDFSDVFSDPDIKKIGHDIKSDLTAGIDIKNIYFDTAIAAYIVSPSKTVYDIAALTLDYLGYDTPNEPSAALSSIVALYEYLKGEIEKCGQNKLFYEVEMPLVEVLADMQKIGVAVDTQKLGEFSDMLGKRINELTAEIFAYADGEFNINSPKQLGEVLFEKLRLPVIKKTKTGFSTDVEVLESLKGSHEIIDLIMEYRHIVKLKGTYADGLMAVINPQTGRIHSSFNQTVTVTGRISSTEPNLQNIPVRTALGKEIRRVFRAGSDDFVLVDADYSQIELRVLAHIAADENMIDAFKDDEDIHTRTASQVFGVPRAEVTERMRTRAKAVNFGIVYGIGAFSLSQDLGISVSEAKKYIENYLNTFSGVKRYMESIIEKGKADGYVTTVLNRRRYLPELKTNNFVTRSYGERIALNTPIQGSAADIIKIAMVRVYKRLKSEGLASRLILQVHDELIVEAKKDEAERVKVILKDEMENAFTLSVPLKVDIGVGKTWYDTK
ncbi:MAG: DNA polymerase I [Firmicutes bacterium ADurb.Bin193]|nr:MAG: DNA polymerase I [Firmicutes bacterium ADurb.Bin193]